MKALEYCLPYEQWAIITLLTPREIIARLNERIGLSGYITIDSFSFIRSRSLANNPTALATISGTIAEMNDNRVIIIKMEMGWIAKMLYTIWLGGVGIVSLAITVSEVWKEGFSAGLLWVLPVLVLLYFIPLIPQKIDRTYAKRYVAGIFA